jgi:hypothetical protein
MTRQSSVLLATAIASIASEPPVLRDLVAKAAEYYQARMSLAGNFTHAESIRNQNFDSHGKKTLDISDTFEIMILEGAPYYRHTGHNGNPLSPRETRKEEEKMRDVARQRRAGNRLAGIYPHGVSIALPIADLTNFDLHASGEATLDGRKAYVIDAVPSARFIADASADPLAKASQMRLWIDEQDTQFVKIRAEVVRAGSRYRPGVVVEVDYEKVRDEVWLMKQFHFKGEVAEGGHFVLAEAEQQCYDYRKFAAESKIVMH